MTAAAPRERRAACAAREALYRLLGKLYLREVDAPMLAALKALSFPPGAAGDDFAEGARLLTRFLAASGEECLEPLAAEYARVFLAAGSAQGKAAFPYESVYAGRLHPGAEACGGDAAARYAERGLSPARSDFRAPADHIGLELSFMAHLCRGTEAALARGDSAAAEEGAAEEARFFHARLRPWYAPFCRDVYTCAASGFYRGLAKITAGFLDRERERLRAS